MFLMWLLLLSPEMILLLVETELKPLEKLTRLCKFGISISSSSVIKVVSQDDSTNWGKDGGLDGGFFMAELF